MNLKEIKEMLQLMAEHDLTELEIDKEGFRIKLRKGTSGKIVMEGSYPAAPVHPIYPSAQNGLEAPASALSPPLPDSVPSNLVTVQSPMVGTYYAAPSPDQAPYVNMGSRVKEGDVLCIIEAMKLMNEIKSEVTGEVIEILVKNGQPIEFDQVLFKIRKE